MIKFIKLLLLLRRINNLRTKVQNTDSERQKMQKKFHDREKKLEALEAQYRKKSNID